MPTRQKKPVDLYQRLIAMYDCSHSWILDLITEGEKSRKQSIYVKDADGNLPDSEEVSNN